MSSRCTSGTRKAWTSRNAASLEAVLKHAKVTRHLWLIACDANMCPEDYGNSFWFQWEQMYVVAPKEASVCRSR